MPRRLKLTRLRSCDSHVTIPRTGRNCPTLGCSSDRYGRPRRLQSRSLIQFFRDRGRGRRTSGGPRVRLLRSAVLPRRARGLSSPSPPTCRQLRSHACTGFLQSVASRYAVDSRILAGRRRGPTCCAPSWGQLVESPDLLGDGLGGHSLLAAIFPKERRCRHRKSIGEKHSRLRHHEAIELVSLISSQRRLRECDSTMRREQRPVNEMVRKLQGPANSFCSTHCRDCRSFAKNSRRQTDLQVTSGLPAFCRRLNAIWIASSGLFHPPFLSQVSTQ